MNIQWYPGHMTKAKRAMKEDMRLIDLVIELVDARAPLASRNPDIDQLGAGKARMVLLNKADLSDAEANEAWSGWFRQQGIHVLKIDARNKGTLKQVTQVVQEACKEKIERDLKRGIKNRPIRAMVVGIPNVGKSSFINRMIRGGGAGKAEVQDRPGVTRQNRWFTVGRGFELLDTPGVLWPKFEDPVVGEHLAFTGAVRDEILDMEGLVARLLELLLELYPNAVNARYKTSFSQEERLPGHVLLEQVGRKRGMLISGGEVNTERAAITVLDEYRSGKLGRITLERP